jgi:hypothetical protein
MLRRRMNMTLPKDEKAIIAGFRTMEDAEQAGKQLKELGTLDISIDRIGYYPTTELERRPENPITGDFPGLANAVYDRDMGQDAGILASATPSASGMSDGNDENVGTDVILAVVISADKFDQAEQIVRKCGGQF